MTERSISDRHRAILRVINEKLDSSGFPPSVREIASAVGLASPSTVKHHLDALEAQGYLAREPGLPRALDLTDKARSELGIEAPAPSPIVRIEIPVSHVEEEGTAIPLVGRGGLAHHGRAARRGRVPPAHLHDGARRPLHARGQRTVHDRRGHLRR